MAENHGAPGADKIHVFIAVNIPDFGAGSPLDEDGVAAHGFTCPNRAVYSAGNEVLRLSEICLGFVSFHSLASNVVDNDYGDQRPRLFQVVRIVKSSSGTANGIFQSPVAVRQAAGKTILGEYSMPCISCQKGNHPQFFRKHGEQALFPGRPWILLTTTMEKGKQFEEKG